MEEGPGSNSWGYCGPGENEIGFDPTDLPAARVGNYGNFTTVMEAFAFAGETFPGAKK